jgi:hypothetical protein
MKAPIILFLGSIFILSCSTNSSRAKRPQSPEVVFTTEGKKAFPDWVFKNVYFEKNDRVYVSGVVDIETNQNPSRGLAAADLQARAELGKIIETRLSSQLQLANEGFGYSDQVLYQIVNLASRIDGLQNVRIEQRGYAQIQFQEGREAKSRYTCYSQASVLRTELDKMIQRSLRKFEKNGDISPLFREKVEKSWKDFFENETSEKNEQNR